MWVWDLHIVPGLLFLGKWSRRLHASMFCMMSAGMVCRGFDCCNGGS